MRGSKKALKTVLITGALGIASWFNAVASGAVTIIRVDGAAGSASPAGFGNNWGSNAYKYLPDALARAQFLAPLDPPLNHVEIWVRGATGAGQAYRPDQSAGNQTGSNLRTASFGLLKNVLVFGGYKGGTGADADTRDPATFVTVLTGNLDDQGSHFDNSFHVVTASNPLITAAPLENCRVDGFTVRDGYAFGPNPTENRGAGFYVHGGASPRVNNCLITQNDAHASIETEESRGCGIYSSSASPVFTNCTISANEMTGRSYGGGAAADGTGTLRLISCTITGNKAPFGAGLASKENNNADPIATPNLHIVNCLINGNQGVSGGPGVLTPPTGGGVSIDRNSTALIVNCTITGNASSRGGGFAQFDNGSTLESSIHNSIIWNNTATSAGAEIYNNVGILHVRHSDVRDRNGTSVSGTVDWGTGTPNTNIGENTTLHDPAFVSGSFHLTCGSPCRDKADSTVVPVDAFNVDSDPNTTEPTPDRDLAFRLVGSQVDMGAYEKQFAPSCHVTDIAPTPCPDGVINVDDLLGVISGWGPCVAGTPCIADIVGPSSSPPDGAVNVDDLLAVINAWGPAVCEGYAGIPGDMPETIEDCRDMCLEQTDSTYEECMEKCLCAIGEIPCN